MSETKWTPGPWSISTEHLRGGKFWTVTRTDTSETIDLHEDDNGEADAHLIAAAPAMAEVLAEVAQTLEFVLEELMTPGAAYEEVEADLNKVRAALSRARGEAS